MTRPVLTFMFDDVTTELTKQCNENGEMIAYTLVVPNFTNAITAAVSYKDSDSHELYTVSGKAKNTTHVVSSLTTPIWYGTFKITLSGAAGGTGGTVYLKPYIRRTR